MQNQPRRRDGREGNIAAVAEVDAPLPETEVKDKKPRVMRQFELIERVRRYNPNSNEALLDRAYVYAMKAHGSQVRASGDPYFSHPLEVAAILTDLKLDDSTIVAARSEERRVGKECRGRCARDQ